MIKPSLLVCVLAVPLLGQQATPHRKSAATIAKDANGAVVSIVMSDKEGHPIAQGSGFLVSKNGQVVTNYHVIKNGSSAVIKLPDGAFFAVDGVLASNKDRDVAIIQAHGNDFRKLILGDSDSLQVGQEVVAIGSPLSLESTVSNGIVSAIRTVEEGRGKLLQITAPISPGSSGGPLFNMAGKVVGITTSHIKGGENLNFAIPIDDVKPMLPAKFPRARALPDDAEPVLAQSESEPKKQGTLAQQKACAEQAQAMFNKRFKDDSSTSFSSYTSHYDPQTSTCYITVSSGSMVGAIAVRSTSIFDAFEETVRAEFTLRCDPDKDRNVDGSRNYDACQTITCYVRPTGNKQLNCKSEHYLLVTDEFSSLIKTYFGIDEDIF
jgi:Trypsin-like peptidase domain